MKFNRRKQVESPSVSITALIDCVFLLLIFFLVTSVFKKFEFVLPVQTALSGAPALIPGLDNKIYLAVDGKGSFYIGRYASGKFDLGLAFDPIHDIRRFLESQQPDLPISVYLAGEHSIGRMVKIADLLRLSGHDQIEFKMLQETALP